MISMKFGDDLSIMLKEIKGKVNRRRKSECGIRNEKLKLPDLYPCFSTLNPGSGFMRNEFKGDP
jgi:hypothetical protein